MSISNRFRNADLGKLVFEIDRYNLLSKKEKKSQRTSLNQRIQNFITSPDFSNVITKEAIDLLNALNRIGNDEGQKLQARLAENGQILTPPSDHTLTNAYKLFGGPDRVVRLAERYRQYGVFVDLNKVRTSGGKLTAEEFDILSVAAADIREEDIEHFLTVLQKEENLEKASKTLQIPLDRLRVVNEALQRSSPNSKEAIEIITGCLTPIKCPEDLYAHHTQKRYTSKDSGKKWPGIKERVYYQQKLRSIASENLDETELNLKWSTLVLKSLNAREPAPGVLIAHPKGYYKVQHSLSGAGAYAILLKAHTEKVDGFRSCISCRGTRMPFLKATEGATTLADDARRQIGAKGFMRIKEALDDVLTSSDGDFLSEEEEFDVMGFSLGGVTAQYITALYPTRVKAALFNCSPGIDKDIIGKFNQEVKKRDPKNPIMISHVVNAGDPVHQMGEGKIGLHIDSQYGKVVCYELTPLDPDENPLEKFIPRSPNILKAVAALGQGLVKQHIANVFDEPKALIDPHTEKDDVDLRLDNYEYNHQSKHVESVRIAIAKGVEKSGISNRRTEKNLKKAFDIYYEPVKATSQKQRLKKLFLAIAMTIPIVGWALSRYLNTKDKKIAARALTTLGLNQKAVLQRDIAVPKNLDDLKTRSFNSSDRKFKILYLRLANQLRAFPDDEMRCSEHTKAIQKTLNRLYATDTYQAYREGDSLYVGKVLPYIQEIQKTAKDIKVGIPGMQVMEDYGKEINEAMAANGKYIKKDDGVSYSWKEFGTIVTKAFNSHRHLAVDGAREAIFWGFKHPKSFVHELSSMRILGRNPKKHFNPYTQGNFNLHTGDYQFAVGDKEKKIAFFHGPTPGIKSDRLADLHADSLEADKTVHLQHILQHESMPGESSHIRRIQKQAVRSGDNYRLLATPLNGKAWNMKRGFQEWSTPQDFFQAYRNFAVTGDSAKENLEAGMAPAYRMPYGKKRRKIENGFFVSDKTMTNAQFEGAFTACQDALSGIEESPYFLSRMSENGMHHKTRKRQLAKGMQVFAQAMLATGALANVAAANGFNGASFGQACRADVDRGAIMNVATRLIMMRYAGEEITEETLNQLVGTTLGRSELVYQKRILKDKFEGLSAFIFLLSDETYKDQIDGAIRSYINDFLPEGSSGTFAPL